MTSVALEPADDDGARREIDTLLERIRSGEHAAREELIRLLHDELHQIAAAIMHAQRPDHTLRATALVNELYLRIARRRTRPWNDREHFIAYAAKAMRNVLRDYAKWKDAEKRRAQREEIDIERIFVEYEGRAIDLLALENALEKLTQSNPQVVAAIEARFYGGATAEEAARIAGLSPRTFDRQWRIAKAWLYKELQ
jgi:RNA polymerase sigma factor (TIGR02999 family)